MRGNATNISSHNTYFLRNANINFNKLNKDTNILYLILQKNVIIQKYVYIANKGTPYKLINKTTVLRKIRNTCQVHKEICIYTWRLSSFKKIFLKIFL